jgi:nucleoside-diphosphate-sugar epimerase
MKVLVTSGAGFISSHTVDLLLEKGYEGVEIRRPKTEDRRQSGGVEIRRPTMGLRDYGLLDRKTTGPEDKAES